MKVLFAGTDAVAIEMLQLAIRFRWPEASFLVRAGPEEAFSLSEDVDLVVAVGRLDGVSTAEFCATVRGFSDVPLIVIGEQDSEGATEEVRILEAGADDYIRSSVELRKLIARVVSLMRRAQAWDGTTSVFVAGPVVLDPDTREVFVDRQRVSLTGKEFDLLHLLMVNKDSVVHHWVLERRMWSGQGASAALLKKYVHRLRRKLNDPRSGEHDLIRNVYGVGYVLAVPQEASQTMADAA